jgi:MoxR-like ATPase
MLYAREGFNIIATANTRDRGVNEMSAALKRRFDFETVFPILDFERELRWCRQSSARLLAQQRHPGDRARARARAAGVAPFATCAARRWPGGKRQRQRGGDGAMDKLTAVMSTAEAVNVAHAVGVRAWFLEQREGNPADLVDCIAGTVVKDNADDRAKLRRYFEQKAAKRAGAHWRAYYEARHRLP